jgi:hypothetical protein
MSDKHANLPATVAAIEATFGGRWGVWFSDTGWWWAARTQALTASELSAGCIPFIQADNAGELTERIREQERLQQSAIPGHARPVKPLAQSPSSEAP